MDLKGAAKVGILAGFVAGLVLGLFIHLAMGPLIAEAEAIEEAAALEAGEELDVPVVPPEVTQAVRVVGSIVLGLLIGVLFALAFPFVRDALPGKGLLSKAWFYGALAFVVFTLLPLLAVPGAPPGVERTPEVEERSAWFAATILAGVGGLFGGYGLYRLYAPRTRSPVGRGGLLTASVAVVALVWALPFLFKPEIGIVSAVPEPLLQTFALLTFVGWALFWALLSTLTALLWPRFEARSARTLAGASA